MTVHKFTIQPNVTRLNFFPIQYCKLIKGGQYKVVRSPETQNWAAKNEHIFMYDDVDSLKLKVYVTSFKHA
jgi:hypothetical protein